MTVIKMFSLNFYLFIYLTYKFPTIRDVFQLETKKLDIEEGETKEVKVWALPREAKEYKNNLVLCVENNPFPIQYMMKCWGVDPTVEIDGPWGTR